MNDSEIMQIGFYRSEKSELSSVKRSGNSVKEGEKVRDSEIIEMFFRRDENAISAAEEKYGSYCRAVARNILNNEQDAEEIMSDTLYKAWENIPPERPENLPGYLAKIAKNLSLNRYDKLRTEKRGKGQIPLIYDELTECISQGASVEKTVEQREITSALNGFLARLSPKKRSLFVLRYWYCLSISEIAAKTGERENTVAVALSRLRQKLYEHFKKEGLI